MTYCSKKYPFVALELRFKEIFAKGQNESTSFPMETAAYRRFAPIGG
jgi:hypothetical protein